MVSLSNHGNVLRQAQDERKEIPSLQDFDRFAVRGVLRQAQDEREETPSRQDFDHFAVGVSFDRLRTSGKKHPPDKILTVSR